MASGGCLNVCSVSVTIPLPRQSSIREIKNERSAEMKTTRAVSLGAAIGVAAFLASVQGALTAGQQAQRVPIDTDDIGGVVTSAKGPEAGVWVIAETTDLPTKFVKIVVTDDRGRYLLPDLPKANYNVWVRGYGLVDSPKVQATPGKILNLTAVVAPNRARRGASTTRPATGSR